MRPEGAMRFPHIKSMKRTFDLFKSVGLNEQHLEKYTLSNPNNLLYYNGNSIPTFLSLR